MRTGTHARGTHAKGRINRVCSKKFVGGVRSRSSGVGRQESGVSGFVALSFLYQLMYYNKDNARFLMVPIRFSQHEHRILTGQKPYFKRVLPLFSKSRAALGEHLTFAISRVC